MNISIGARTDTGGRANNEDCLSVLDKERVPMRADAVLIIADGMGGRANGEEASGIAVKVVRETLMEMLDPASDQALPPAEDILAAALRRANSTVYGLSQDNPELPGMGTTCIAGLVSEGTFTLAHVGDSRAYLLRGDVIKALTADHTYVADQVRAGNMSTETAKTSRFRNVITRAIGISPTVEPDFETVALIDGDTILLCTDGLTNSLDERVILNVASRGESASGTAASLLEAAKAHGANDNITVIAIRVTADVLSSKVRRDQFTDDGAIEKVAVDDIHDPLADRMPEKSPTIQAHPTSNGQSSGFRYVAIAVLSALLGAAVTACSLFELGMLGALRQPAANNPGKHVSGPGQSVDYTSLQFDSPTQLYYKPIRSNFLLLSNGGVLVALAQTGKLVHLNALGQADGKDPSSAIVPISSASPLSYATDSAGNLYYSSSITKAVSQASADGTHRRVIAKNFVKPGALAIDPAGNVYVIDAGELYVLHAQPAAGKP